MPTAKINGIDLYFETSGQGQPLVFIPGLGGTTDLWYAQRAFFSERYHFISLDNRGAGRSDKPAGPYTMQQFADDLHALLDHLEIAEPILLVGASMGGIIAQAFIHDHPQRVAKLALVCSGVSGGDSHYVPPEQAVIDKILRPGNTPEEKIDTFLEIFYHPDFVSRHPQVRDYYLSRKIEPQPAHAYMAQLGACYDHAPTTGGLATLAYRCWCCTAATTRSGPCRTPTISPPASANLPGWRSWKVPRMC